MPRLQKWKWISHTSANGFVQSRSVSLMTLASVHGRATDHSLVPVNPDELRSRRGHACLLCDLDHGRWFLSHFSDEKVWWNVTGFWFSAVKFYSNISFLFFFFWFSEMTRSADLPGPGRWLHLFLNVIQSLFIFFLSDRINQFSFSFSEGDFQRRFVDTLWLRIGKNLVIRYDHDTGVTIR